MSRGQRWALVAVIALAVAAFFALGLNRYLSLEFVKSQQARLEAWHAAQPLRAGLGFFALYVAVTALSLPGATILTLAAGAIFGLGWGTLIASFAASAGATLAFLSSRLVLRDWVQSHFGERLAAINEGVRKDGGFYLFTLRVAPVFPFFLINLAMGLTPIGTLRFYGVSQIGMLPGTLAYVNAGTQLGRIDTLSDVLSPGLLLSFALLGVLPLLAKLGIDRYRARTSLRRWKRPARFDCNLLVIGAGSAGLVAAYVAAAVKARVTLVERDRMGGDCLNTGCVPSKALIRSARLLSDIARSAEFGIRHASAEFDFAEVMARVQRVVQAIEPHDAAARYRGLGVDVVQGEARLISPWEVGITRADGSVQRISARAIVIATGARPVVPDIPGIAASGYLTSETLWSLRRLPARLLVLGGGPIGAELAQAFARLGSRVTLLESGPRLLPREDEDVAALITRQFVAEGIAVCAGHRALRFERAGEAQHLIAEHQGRDVRIGFDTLLVAAGRTARLEGFGLEDLGIATGKTIETNAFQQTSLPNVYAAGDVAGPWQFTHTASHQAGYAAVNALLDPFWRFRVDHRVIPSATFVEPEIARVGLNEQEARAKNVPYELTTFPLADLDRAIADGEARGFVKLLTVPGKDRILGASIVGPHAADLLAEIVLAMKHGIGLNQLLGTIHTYPTMAEASKSAAGAWKRAHAPARLLAIAERFHAWRRG